MNCSVLSEIILIYFLTLQPWISCSARCSIGHNYTARCLACHYFCDLSQTSRDCCPLVSRGTIGRQLSIECLIHILVSHFPARSCSQELHVASTRPLADFRVVKTCRFLSSDSYRGRETTEVQRCTPVSENVVAFDLDVRRLTVLTLRQASNVECRSALRLPSSRDRQGLIVKIADSR
jgi:hypothetical protein